MEYFKPKTFILDLRNRLLPSCLVQVSEKGKPLCYQVTSPQGEVVTLWFEEKNAEVSVALRSESPSGDSFLSKVQSEVSLLLAG